MTDVATSRKQEALDSLRREHAALGATLDQLTPEQMTASGVYPEGNTDWTVKDILAHLTWWEQSIFGWLGQPFAATRTPLPEGNLDDDQANEAIFQANRHRSLDDVLSSFHRSYSQLEQAIANVTEEQLASPRQADPDGPPLYEIIPGNSYEHYGIHHQSLREWLDKQA